MTQRKVTVLDPQPVRYSYSQPSMRRGGVRLHPVKDGVLPMGEQLCYIRKRDRSGQKLRDVIDPQTGWVINVTSNLEACPNNHGAVRPGISGSHTVETRRADVVPAVDTHGRKVYRDAESGRVIRTCDMAEAPIPSVKTATPTPAPKPQKERAMTRTPGRSTVPGATGPGGRITRSDCEALIRAMAATKGQAAPKVITKPMLAAAKAVLRDRINQARKSGLVK